MTRTTTLLALLLSTPAVAGDLVEGDAIRIHYSDIGVWNDAEESRGFQAKHDGTWVDYTWPGTPFAAWQIAWDDGGSAPEQYYATSVGYETNATVTESVASASDGWLSMVHEYDLGDLSLRKTETWAVDGTTLFVHLRVVNAPSRSLSNLRWLFAMDPDQDYLLGTTNTVNEAVDVDNDGLADVVLAVGPSSGNTIGVGACADSEVGTFTTWQGQHDADVSLHEPAAELSDSALAVRIHPGSDIKPGASFGMSYLVVVGDTSTEALAAFRDGLALCGSCDADSDGWLGEDCGGADCDDDDASAFPGGLEIWYDGVDGDCDGASDYDADGDGYDSDGYGGDDCDDQDAEVNPGIADVPYDGVDDDCSGGNDYDADGDGHVSAGHSGDDCDDADPEIYPGAPDTMGDGIDSDCDGEDGQAVDPELVSGGCGCTSGAGLMPAWWLLGLGLAAFRRRRT